MIVFFVITIRIIFAESRVYCQDSNASPWMPLGYSCPINCFNINAAIERLKMLDYQSILTNDLQIRKKLKINQNRAVNLRNKPKYPPKIYINGTYLKKEIKIKKIMKKEYNNIIRNENALRDLNKELQSMADVENTIFQNGGCEVTIGPLFKNLYNKCTRRFDYERDFMRIFTKILNKYTHSEYKFTEEMTSILLKKIFGKNMDLRHGILDISQILEYLKRALRQHSKHMHGKIIRLQSKHCMGIYVPGCYCRRGFVESEGQCVHPADCFKDTNAADYLTRIILI